jgi:hypothetical protein
VKDDGVEAVVFAMSNVLPLLPHKPDRPSLGNHLCVCGQLIVRECRYASRSLPYGVLNRWNRLTVVGIEHPVERRL